LALMVVPMAMAAESVIERQITDKVVAPDRNGNEYIRFIVGETKTLQGVEYQVGVPAMAFGSVVEAAKSLNIGDTLKAIVQEREFQGRQSYTILKLL